MGLETATYIDDLVPSNPLSTDAVSQGDDHLRLIKQVLQNSFPDFDKPLRKWRTEAISANETVTGADDGTLYVVDASGGGRTVSLPAASSNVGVLIGVKKGDSSANVVTMTPNGSDTIDGVAGNRTLGTRGDAIWFLSDGTGWQIPMNYSVQPAAQTVLAKARVAKVSNVALASGLQSGSVVDGVTLSAGDIVLLTGQTAPAENGLYISPASGTASRAPGFTTWSSLVGTIVVVVEGTDNGDKVFRNKSGIAGTLGTTAIVYTQLLTIDDFTTVEPDVSRDDYVLGVNGSTGKTVLIDIGDFPGVRQLHVRDQKSAGSDGGNGVSGMNIRTLNTTVDNSITGASRSGNQIILPSGTYDIHAIVPCSVNGKNQATTAQAYLYNVTDSSTTIVGTSCRLSDGGDFHEGVVQQGLSHVRGRFTITAQKTFEIRMNMYGNNRGMGRSADCGMTEVYTEVIITKVE